MPRLPPPLPLHEAGDPTWDAAANHLGAHFGDHKADTDAAIALFEDNPAEASRHLLAMLVPAAWAHHVPASRAPEGNDDPAKMTPKARAEYQKLADQAYSGWNIRKRYCGWLIEEVARTPDGQARLIELLRREDTPAGLAVECAEELGKHPALAKVWKPAEYAAVFARVPRAFAYFVVTALREGANPQTFIDFIAATPAAAATVFEAVDGLRYPEGTGRFYREEEARPIDRRWLDVAVQTIAHGDDASVVAAADLLRLDEPTPAWADALATLTPKRLKHAVETLEGTKFDPLWLLAARLRDPRLVPLYVFAIDRPLAPKDELFEALIAVNDPGSHDAIAAYLEADKSRLKREKKLDAQKAAAKAAGVGVKKAKPGPTPPEPVAPVGAPEHPKLQSLKALAADLRAGLAAAGLEDREELLVDPAFALLPTRVKDEAKLAVGATKLGGRPDLPADVKWPVSKGVAMAFVAQVDLAEFQSPLLPKSGLLLFFVDDESFGESYLAKAAVLHVESKKLVRTDPPPSLQKLRDGHPARAPYPACSVKLVPTLTIPSTSNKTLTAELSEVELEKFGEHVKSEQPIFSQLLGYRNHGYDAENPATARLLLRVASEGQAAMSWGDEDCLDFYLPKKALAKGDFSKVYPYVGD